MKKLIPLSVLFAISSFANIHTGNVWKNYDVTTCFASGEKGSRDEGYVLKVREWSEKDKTKIRNWVNSEYTAERTGVHFTGFLDCEDSPNADVIIFYNKNSKIKTFLFGGIHGLATMGPYPGSVEGYPAASSFASISKSGMDKGTVVHEFGHVVGLAHEHNHPDAYKEDKGRCLDIPKHFQAPKRDYVYEDYDRDSVMNYCKLHSSGGSKVGLSPKDISLIRKMYP